MNPSVPSETSGDSSDVHVPSGKFNTAPTHTDSSNSAATMVESTVNKTSHQKQVFGFMELENKHINSGINAQKLEHVVEVAGFTLLLGSNCHKNF